MDYITKSTTRADLRRIAKIIRKIFGVKDCSYFPVLDVLEMLPDIFPGTIIVIVNDEDLPANVPARCYPDDYGNFTIEIKECVYNGAYKNEIGAYRGHIMHEIAHVFLYKIGFRPIFERRFADNVIPAYCSVEWQAKALCGEIMMPYEATKNMEISEIMENFGVSKGFATHRQKY